MDIEIRRNRDIKFDFELSDEQRKALGDIFRVRTGEYLSMLDDAAVYKREICDKIMLACVKTGQRDLDGNLITPETHEVDCDVDFTNYNGEQWAYPKQWYVRPKKSEYEK